MDVSEPRVARISAPVLANTKMTRFFCISLVIIMTLIGYHPSHAQDIKNISNVVDLAYPGAYEIQKTQAEGKNIQFVYYKVNEKYPSLKVYEFYANILRSRGYEQIEWEGQQSGSWSSFIDSTIEGRPVVYECSAIWSDIEQKVMFILSLRYYSHSNIKRNAPDNDVQHVYFQERPFLRLH